MNSVHAISFGMRLRRLRTERRLSRTAAAQQVGTQWKTWAAWEEGRTLPTYEPLLALADFFGVSTDALMRPSAAAAAEPSAFGPVPLSSTGRAIFANLVAATA